MLAIAGAAAFLLCGYEFIRSVSTSLFLEAYGKERLPLIMALMPAGVLLTLYGYGFILSRCGPARTLLISSGSAAAIIFACYRGIGSGWAPAAGILYIFREAYIVIILEQYWALINSTLSTAHAKKLNGPITGVASLGAILGATLVNRFAERIGTETFLLFAAASLIPAGILSGVACVLAGEPQPAPQEAGGRQGHLALRLFLRSRYLFLFAALIATTQIMSAVLDLRFSGLVDDTFAVKDQRTAYLGGFYAILNVTASGLQFLIAPLLLHRAPLRVVHAGIPLIHLCAGLALLLHPSLRMGAAAFLLFKCLDYSVFRAAKEIFYIPLSFDVRYRAKEVIDAFVYRFSKGALGLLAAGAGGILGSLPYQAYPSVAMAAALIWLPVVLRLTHWHEQEKARV